MRRFVADVSHELRTPLAAVSAYTELFERGARDHPEDLERRSAESLWSRPDERPGRGTAAARSISTRAAHSNTTPST